MIEDPLSVLIVELRYFGDIADDLLKGAKAALESAGAVAEVVSVPGALELPAVIAIAEEGGHRPAGVNYDGYVALGCVIRDGTRHFDIIAGEATRGLMDLAIGRRLAIGNGVLALESLQEAKKQATDRGARAANSCLEIIALKRRLLGQSR